MFLQRLRYFSQLVWGKEFTIACLALLAGLGLIEVILGLTDADYEAIRPLLYYEGAFPQLSRVSKNPQKLFELQPLSHDVHLKGAHPRETKYVDVEFRINSLGFRERERRLEKEKDVFRILVFGGSNTFGFAVNEEDTYPSVMERMLNERSGRKYEVWNAGVSAYVMSQNVAYAEELVPRLKPDLIIFQRTNMGRRAFTFIDKNPRNLLRQNTELYFENVPCLWGAGDLALAVHYLLARYVRTYRFVMAKIYLIKSTRFMTAAFRPSGDLISRRDFLAFLDKHPDIKIILFEFGIPSKQRYPWQKNYYRFSLGPEFPQIDEYIDFHPPSHVYRLYSIALVKFLHDNHIVP